MDRKHPGHLAISGAPWRKGKYLYIEKGSRHIAVARFMNDKAVSEFIDWAKKVSEQGLVIKWTEEDESQSEEEKG